MPDPPGSRLLTPRFGLIVTSGLAYFMSLGMLMPIVPKFVEGPLGGGAVAVGVAVGAFSVGAVALRPMAGRIGDRSGRRPLIVGGALLVAVSSMLYVLADGLVALVGARFLGGLGEAAFFVGAGTMITDLAPEQRRGEAISYWSVAVYGGLALGPSLGETLLAGSRFDRVWVVAAALALLAGIVGVFTRETAELDAAPRSGGRRPALLHRDALAPGAVLFLGMVGLAGFAAFVPLYVAEVGVRDSRQVFLLYGCVILAVRVLGARVPDRIGPLRAGSLALSTSAVGLVVLAVVASPGGLYFGTAVFAAGMSMLFPSMMTLTLTGMPANERGSAVGTVSTFFDLSQGSGAVLLGGVAAVGGYRGAFAAAAVMSVAGLVLLRSGIDPRVHGEPDPAAARAAAQYLEPEPP